jgi:hypothetical protein
MQLLVMLHAFQSLHGTCQRGMQLVGLCLGCLQRSVLLELGCSSSFCCMHAIHCMVAASVACSWYASVCVSAALKHLLLLGPIGSSSVCCGGNQHGRVSTQRFRFDDDCALRLARMRTVSVEHTRESMVVWVAQLGSSACCVNVLVSVVALHWVCVPWL